MTNNKEQKLPFISTDDYWEEISGIANDATNDIAELLQCNGNEPTKDNALNIKYGDYTLIWVDDEGDPFVFDKNTQASTLVRELLVSEILDLADVLNESILNEK